MWVLSPPPSEHVSGAVRGRLTPSPSQASVTHFVSFWYISHWNCVVSLLFYSLTAPMEATSCSLSSWEVEDIGICVRRRWWSLPLFLVMILPGFHMKVLLALWNEFTGGVAILLQLSYCSVNFQYACVCACIQVPLKNGNQVHQSPQNWS